jgi:hypothetical protein
MTATLLVYFILTKALTWEFFAVEHTDKSYCEMSSDSLKRNFAGKIGNMKIICAPDVGADI